VLTRPISWVADLPTGVVEHLASRAGPVEISKACHRLLGDTARCADLRIGAMRYARGASHGVVAQELLELLR
jgi:hypothetical protein